MRKRLDHLTGFLLLSIVCMASAVSALAVKRASAAKWDALVNESMQSRPVGTEFFSTCSSNCPAGWVTYRRRCFTYFADRMDWAFAEQHCLKFGANLVSIHNENEHQLVRAIIRAHDPKENPTWIGLSDCQENNVWIWSDGNKLNYTNWNPDEPNSLHGECCVHMNWSVEKKWNDIPCALKYSFVCVKKFAEKGRQT